MPLRSLVPVILGKDWWDAWDYPSRIMDQCFACHIEDDDLLKPTYIQGLTLRPRSQANIADSGKSEVKNTKKEFKVELSMNQFKPDDIQVKVVNNFIEIRGKHEEKSEEQGFVAREFQRRYMLPRGCEPETVVSSLSPDGILTVLAPKKPIEEPPKKERNVPIEGAEK